MGQPRDITEFLTAPARTLCALRDSDLVALADLALANLDEAALASRQSAGLWTGFVHHLADEAARRRVEIDELERLYRAEPA